MTCSTCTAARETAGHWRYFDPACLFCGARLIQRIGTVKATKAEISQRRTVVLKDWIAQDHSEKELRELAAGPMCFEPVQKEVVKVKGRK